LKLVTGVEISTRPVRRSGRPGKKVNRARRRAAAAAKTPAVLPWFALPAVIAQAIVSGVGEGGGRSSLVF